MLWIVLTALVLFVAFYVRLALAPIPMPFIRDQARAVVLSSLPDTYRLELGDTALALEGPFWPVIQFHPVSLTDRMSGARIEMGALEVGFSPIRALFGQPGVAITMVRPHIQVIQDLFGPRLSSFKIINNPDGGPPTVRILAGEDNYPAVGISQKGIDIKGTGPRGAKVDLRSDNDWLIFNLQAAEQGMADIVKQAEEGRFSHLVIRDGTLDMNDNVYSRFRRFADVNFDIVPGNFNRPTRARLSAVVGGRKMTGTVTRTLNDDGSVALDAKLENVDFASLLPFVDDPDGIVAIKGGGKMDAKLHFAKGTHKITRGDFHVDLTGTQLRVKSDFFPVTTKPFDVVWSPDKSQFSIDGVQVKVGQSSATLSGIFALGLDRMFGPTVGISMTATDVHVNPGDLATQATPFSEIEFHGWSAPLYGAVGVDRLVASKPGVNVVAKGRLDMLRKGLGIDLTVSGAGASADDLKRLWPYFLAPKARNWFVRNVNTGKVESANMRFSFPVGTLGTVGDPKPIPQNGMRIDLVGDHVSFVPVAGMKPVAVNGKTRVRVRDNKLTVGLDGAKVSNKGGDVRFSNAAFVIENTSAKPFSFELSGDIDAPLPALVAMTGDGPGEIALPEDLKSKVPLDGMSGNVKLSLVSTITLDDQGKIKKTDYAANGSIRDFASKTPIADHSITDGALSFTASQSEYRVTGQAKIDGMGADILLKGKPGGDANVLLSSTVDVADLKALGFDATEFLKGSVRFVGKPLPDGTLQLAIDLKQAKLDINDLGIHKPVGTDGTLDAAIKQDGTRYEVNPIKLDFGDVHLDGSLVFDSEKGLESAEFSNFALNPGDKAQVAITPLRDGYSVRVRGDQMDLKPMLKRFLGLGPDSGLARPQRSTDLALSLDIQLKRALGFYRTTAFNFNLKVAVQGSDMQNIELQAQLGGTKSVSITTNELTNGRVTSVAFNDLGTLLRFAGTYPRVLGGSGSMVINTDNTTKVDKGEFDIRDFAIVNESNIAQILGNHKDSRSLISKENRVTFHRGRARFVHTPDRIDVRNAVLSGDTVGGTMHGAIYTKTRKYDLVGTYVPLFGINSIFQKLPILGPLIGGRDGEGLIGVTFAIRGDLDKPQFLVNPASALVPGVFRQLFEFRAEEDRKKRPPAAIKPGQ